MRGKRLAAVLLGGVLVISACGGDDDSADSTTTSGRTGLSSTSLVTTTVAGEESAPGAGSQDAGSATSTTPDMTDPKAGPPRFLDFSVTADDCPTAEVAPDVSVTLPPFEGVVTVSWSVAPQPAELYTAVDNPDGPYETDLPTSGSRTFTRQCDGAHTYYVVAVAANGQKVVESQEVPAG